MLHNPLQIWYMHLNAAGRNSIHVIYFVSRAKQYEILQVYEYGRDITVH